MGRGYGQRFVFLLLCRCWVIYVFAGYLWYLKSFKIWLLEDQGQFDFAMWKPYVCRKFPLQLYNFNLKLKKKQNELISAVHFKYQSKPNIFTYKWCLCFQGTIFDFVALLLLSMFCVFLFFFFFCWEGFLIIFFI